MAKPLVTDDLWRLIKPLIPKRPPRPKGGRPPVGDREALTGIRALTTPRALREWGEQLKQCIRHPDFWFDEMPIRRLSVYAIEYYDEVATAAFQTTDSGRVVADELRGYHNIGCSRDLVEHVNAWAARCGVPIADRFGPEFIREVERNIPF